MIEQNSLASPTERDGWFKSSHSNGSGSCVEVKFTDGATLLRDSKDKRFNQPMISISMAEWSSFLSIVTDLA